MGFRGYKPNFQILITSLRYSGCWIDDEGEISKLRIAYLIVVNVIFIIALNVSLVILFFKNSRSVEAIAAMGYIVPTVFMVLIKSYYLSKNRRLFNKLLKDLDQTIFQPKNAVETDMMDTKLHSWRKVMTFLLFLSLSTVAMAVFTPFIYLKDGGLPLQAWYPIDIRLSPLHEIAYIHQALSLACNAGIGIATDLTVSGLCFFIGIQCDLLCKRLEQLGNHPDNKENKRELVYCIEHHYSIIKFLEITKQVFGPIYFAQLFSSSTAMCMDFFLLSLSEPTSFEFFYLGLYLVTIANLILVPCWFATQMTRKSENIPNAAYFCNWIGAPKSFKKELLFFIQRSQKPLKLYAANYMEISVETFVKIIRTSYSYFAVLQNLTKTGRKE